MADGCLMHSSPALCQLQPNLAMIPNFACPNPTASPYPLHGGPGSVLQIDICGWLLQLHVCNSRQPGKGEGVSCWPGWSQRDNGEWLLPNHVKLD